MVNRTIKFTDKIHLFFWIIVCSLFLITNLNCAPDPDGEPPDWVSDYVNLEIKHLGYDISRWFGGDNRSDIGPRDLGFGQSITFEHSTKLKSFAFYLTTYFDYAENPESVGHAVILILNIRDSNGNVLQSEWVKLDADFSGGWVIWSSIDRSISQGSTLIFTTYLMGAYNLNPYNSEYAVDSGNGFSKGAYYQKSGTSDSDMEDWINWEEMSGEDSNFWLVGSNN